MLYIFGLVKHFKMEVSYEIEVECLTVPEVDYELSIRGFDAGSEEFKRRKCLRRLLAGDYKRAGISYSACKPFNRDTDGGEIDCSISLLSSAIESYAGTLDSVVVEIRSRLNHVKGRLLRISSADTDAKPFKNDRLISVISLEDDFLSKLPIVTPAEEVQRTVESDRTTVASQLDGGSVTMPVTDTTEAMAVNSIINCSTPCKHPASSSVFKWGIKFNGETSEESVAELLQRLEELRSSRGVSKDELYRAVTDLLEGPALSWYRSVRNSITSWDDFLIKLKAEFQPIDYENDLWNEIFHRVQGPDEKVGTYFSSMINLFSRLSTSTTESQRLNVIRRNLAPYYLNHLGTSALNTVDELSVACKRLEENKYHAERNSTGQRTSRVVEPTYAYKKPKPRSVGRVGQISALSSSVCWNCRESGHLSFNCDKPRTRFCFGCGNPGVLRRACPVCQGNANGGSS